MNRFASVFEKNFSSLRPAAVVLAVALSGAATAQEVTVRMPDGFGISPPMRDLPKAPKYTGRRLMPEPQAEANFRLPPTGMPDPLVVKPQAPVLAGPSPGVLASFDGIGGPGQMGGAPPDTDGDVSPLYYAQYVNTSWAVFNKSTGAMLSGFPKAGNTFWSTWSTANCPTCTTAQKACGDRNDGDPIVKYDRGNDRWIFTQFAVPNNRGPDYQCIAVSTTNDPTGTYYLYAYQVLTQFNDYPKLGVWPDAYYITYNMFTNRYQGPGICAYDRASMVAGNASAVQQCTQLANSYYSILPVDWNGSTAPPTGAAAYLVSLNTSTSLYVWRAAVTWGASPTLTLTGPTSVTVASYTQTCAGGTCVPQPGTTQQLDSLADRLMYRFAYRNFGTFESFLVSHSVDPTGSGTSSGGSGVRWYELRNTPPATSGTAIPSLYQQGTHAPSNTQFRWMPSIGQDKTGDIAIGYSLSDSSTNKPSVVVTGRSPDETAGAMRTETVAQAGGGVQTRQNWAGDSRWGDYSAMAIDPADDCTFWYTTEYLKSNTTSTQDPNWSTRIVSFRVAPNPPSGLTATPGVNQIALSWNAVAGALSYTILRSDGGCPGGSFSVIASGVTSTSYTDTTTVGGNTYSYVVRTVACDTSGDSSCASATAQTPPCTTPGTPTLNALTTPADNRIDLTWSAGTPAGVTYKIYRSVSTNCAVSTTLLASGVAGTTYSDTSVTGGTTYSYQVSAVDATGNCESSKSNCRSTTATGVYSSGRANSGRPQDTASTGQAVRWIYNTPASALTPPSVNGSVYAVSNDRYLHSMVAGQGTGAGTWPTSPATWAPVALNAPAQSRPPVIPTTVIPGHSKLVFVGAQDGRVYCLDGDSGQIIWASAILGDYIQGSPNGMFSVFGGAWDLVFVGTRNSTSANTVYALKVADGAQAWSFNNGGGAGSIGIVSAGVQVDYTNKRLYFTSRKYTGGSPNTLWCLSFTNASASLLWASNAPSDIDSAASLLGTKLYVGDNTSRVWAFNPATGAALWSSPFTCTDSLGSPDGPVKAFVTPDYGSSNLYLATSTKVWSISDAGSSASLNWSVGTISNPSPALFIRGLNLVFVGSGDGRLYQVASPSSMKSVTIGGGTSQVGSPTLDVANSMVYVGTAAGDVYAVVVPLP